MERILIKDIAKNENKEIRVFGRISNIRKLGNLNFILVGDYTGIVQSVWEKEIKAGMGDAVEITGIVRHDKRAKGGYEISGKELKIISKSKELPFDLSKNELTLQLNTLLDRRTISLRHPKIQAIFKLYDILLESYETVMREEGFTEVKTPKLLETASEGGANFFKVDYFDKKAFLAQSPQLYKQIMVGVFERVFEIGPVFRAEPHFTTRHINEYISLDAEMGFIDSYKDVIETLSSVIRKMIKIINEKGKDYLKIYNANPVEVPKTIPHIKLAEAKEKINKKYGYSVPKDTDIDPEGERLISKFVKEEFGSDFVFVTHYPWEHRPFYTMPDKENPGETFAFDLLFRGVELVSGSQRIHLYDELIDNMNKKGVKPRGLEFYLETFKYGMPPHGGWAIGSERFIQLILGLKNVKEAVLFPRDVKRLSP
jgi:nondiscriminating aspartyl-tRNA synthetase